MMVDLCIRVSFVLVGTARKASSIKLSAGYTTPESRL